MPIHKKIKNKSIQSSASFYFIVTGRNKITHEGIVDAFSAKLKELNLELSKCSSTSFNVAIGAIGPETDMAAYKRYRARTWMVFQGLKNGAENVELDLGCDIDAFKRHKAKVSTSLQRRYDAALKWSNLLHKLELRFPAEGFNEENAARLQKFDVRVSEISKQMREEKLVWEK